MLQALFRDRPGADQSVLGLEENLQIGRNVVRNQRRNADAEIDEHSRAQFERDTAGDNGLCVHGLTRSQ